MATPGWPVSNYLGVDGILPRTDVANTDLPNHPRVLLELGADNASGENDDLAVLGTDAGRVAMSRCRGIVNGIVNFLTGSGY